MNGCEKHSSRAEEAVERGREKKNVCSCSSHVVKFEKVVRAERTNNAHDESLLPCVLRVVVCGYAARVLRKRGNWVCNGAD